MTRERKLGPFPPESESIRSGIHQVDGNGYPCECSSCSTLREIVAALGELGEAIERLDTEAQRRPGRFHEVALQAAAREVARVWNLETTPIKALRHVVRTLVAERRAKRKGQAIAETDLLIRSGEVRIELDPPQYTIGVDYAGRCGHIVDNYSGETCGATLPCERHR